MFKRNFFIFFSFNILAFETEYCVEFKYNDMAVYKYMTEDTLQSVTYRSKEKTVKINELKKVCIDAMNEYKKHSKNWNEKDQISYDDTTLLYVMKNTEIVPIENDEGEVDLDPNLTLKFCFFSKSIIESIRKIEIKRIIINGHNINASFKLENLPKETFQKRLVNWDYSIINYVVDNSEEVKNFVKNKKYEKRCGSNLWYGNRKIDYLGGIRLIDNPSDLVGKDKDIKLGLHYKWKKCINVKYKVERDDLKLRDYEIKDNYMCFYKDDGYGENYAKIPIMIEYYYDEKNTPEEKEGKVRECMPYNEYEHGDIIYDCYDSKEVKKQKVENNNDRIQLPEGVTWDNLGDPGTYVNYILSERSEAVKTKIINLSPRINGEMLSEECRRPIIIVLDGDDCSKEALKRKLEEKTFGENMKLSEETINKFLNGELELKDGGYCELEVTEKEKEELLDIYMNNKLEENNKEDEKESKENKHNNKVHKITNIPNFTKCCCCTNSCCK